MVGKVTSKGDRAMRAQIARRNFSIDGRGITIGVISDSFNSLKQADRDVASGDLPGRQNPFGYRQPIRVLRDLRSGGDEGRAMMQIISDIAPGASLMFHTAFTPKGRINEQSFTRAVKELARAGADIIVDDLGFSTTLFQDGIAARTVSRLVDRGIDYFSAIGNDGNRAYVSPFRLAEPSSADNTFEFRGNRYEMHDFDAGEGVDLYQNVRLEQGATLSLALGWDDPSGRVKNDLELFLVSEPTVPVEKGNILATSITLVSAGVEQPLEELFYSIPASRTAYLVIARKVDPATSPTQMQWISTANGADSAVTYEYVDASGNNPTVYGQPNARGAVAVGAVEVRKTPVFGVNPPVLDSFSSRGGTPILLDAEGNRLRAPEIRAKPELVAPNGVATTFESFSGFNPFFGTSAAAPHAAAVAALLLQRAGGPKQLSPAQVTQAMQATAIPLDPPDNFRSGAGLVQADAAALAAYKTRIDGTPGNDRLQSGATADNLSGLAGADRLQGNRGFDALLGGSQADQLLGNRGNDYLLGQTGNDRLLGGKGNDTLVGNQGQDRLDGEAGNDLLAGGAGRNQLQGGAGSDLFVLTRSGTALIQDFQPEQDRIALDAGLNFGQIRQIEQGDSLLLQWRGQPLARLLGVIEPLSAQRFSAISIHD
jgi:Ca2+-binding RTX toxin-like protein